MEGEQRDPGYDDWFDEPEPPTETNTGISRSVYEDADEVWVLPDDEEPARRRGGSDIVIAGRTLTRTQLAIIAASLLALFFAILAAAGVFSGSKATVPPVTTPTHPITTQQTTTQAATTTQTVEAPAQTLQPGDTGAQVKLLQQALISLGYLKGPVDGVYGINTKVAVEKFQIDKGLAEDGVVGPQTLNALQKAVANQ
jgi:Putative peptidoglycan binding domain